ncbi:maleylpyruvate isomerase family mycothiol-dependent enzyme [Actinomadura rifamycini]|uniref:maleylpyruvate isomerase family mycothiol-dependent enzyme n=1 Tax=Actinomadura rifamycini TaxID=31962 RepID=UPI000425F40D|nr:maleylpyruvate isomerase family mycothiol-dependent enzyme [Actinomadura rifamycini]
MDVLDITRIAEGLREHTAGLADAASRRAPDTVVPTCPEWTLRDLVGHVGQAHRWAAAMFRRGGTRVTDELPRDTPADQADWGAWLREGAAEAIAAQAEHPGAVAHPVMGDAPSAMWLRRMLHDTSVHHADATITAGTPFAIAPDLAADELTETFGLLTAPAAAHLKPELGELRGSGETLCLRADEPSVPGWLITRTPDAAVVEYETRDADMTIAGPVRDLMLVFARRLSPDDAAVKITGDRALLDHWLEHTAV